MSVSSTPGARSRVVAGAVLLVAALLVALSPHSAEAAPPVYKIRQLGTYQGHTMCMTAHGHLKAVTIQYCNGSSAQKWRYAKVSGGGAYAVLSPLSSPTNAISISPIEHGTKAVLRNLSGSQYQGFTWDALGNNNWVIYMSAHRNHVLGTNSKAPGSVVRDKAYAGCTCNGRQSWKLVTG
jgi:hypothetical protein